MKKRKFHSLKQYITIAVYLFLCLFISEPLISQDLNFRHLSIADGLSQNAVYSILQDSCGFIWFGIVIQFFREQCVRGMSAKTYNPDEESGAGNRLGLSFTNEIIKATGPNYYRNQRTNKGTISH